MLVKYKNLASGKLTEEEDLFIGQLHKKFPDIGERFIRAVVKCIKHAIFRESELRILKIRDKLRTLKTKTDDINKEHRELTIMRFFSELKKFSRDITYDPVINLDLEGFDGEDIKFLLGLSQQYSITDTIRFARSYNTTIPNVSLDRMCEVVEFIFDTMREATERGLKGERNQAPKLRAADDAWRRSSMWQREAPAEAKADNSDKENKSVSICPHPTVLRYRP